MNRLAMLAVPIALVLASCGSSGEVAATVNGEEITADVTAQLAGEDATPEVQAQALGTLVQWSITAQAAKEQFGFEPTEDEIQAEVDGIVTLAGAESLSALAETEGVSEDILRRYITQLMIQDAVNAELEAVIPQPADEAVTAELVDNAPDWTVVCAAHLLVETEEEALAALARAGDGEDFGAIAAEVSTDTASATNNGDLGCAAAGGFVDAFAEAAMTAEIGVLTGPVQTEFGYHVVLVNSREIATTDQVREALVTTAVSEAADAWFVDAMRAANVVITDGFGTWVTEPTPAVVPPVS
ncbi:MAG TPA: peptidylprolyl isomerase [Acidimicrobiia bacterium]|nr:peptidylprolyl isomerase [Acidimicrobiia bacterium]